MKMTTGRAVAATVGFAIVLVTGAAMAADGDEVIAAEGTIGANWAAADGARFVMPGYPPALATRGDDVCIALGYRINPDGTTSGFRVLKQWSSEGAGEEPVAGYWRAFAGAAADAVAQWHFQPRAGVTAPEPTFTVATLGFKGGEEFDWPEVSGHCRIGDLKEHLAALELNESQRRRQKNVVYDEINFTRDHKPQQVHVDRVPAPRPPSSGN